MHKERTYLDTSVISVYVSDRITDNDRMSGRRVDTHSFWEMVPHAVEL